MKLFKPVFPIRTICRRTPQILPIETTITTKSSPSGGPQLARTIFGAFLCFGWNVALLAFCVSHAALAQDINAAQSRSTRHGWVQVPGMLVRADCVHEIPKGAKVAIENDTVTGDVRIGGVLVAHYDPCPEAPEITRPRESAPSRSSAPAIGNGWVEAAQKNLALQGGDSIDYLTGTWIVPPNPPPSEESPGSLIYFFNAITPASQNWILQPVLQWGRGPNSGSGDYWVIASWLVGNNGYVYNSTPERVSSGDTIEGTTWIKGETGGTLNWEVYASDTTTGAYSWITANSSALQWTWAYAGVLEAYNISSCSQFPPNGETAFQNNAVYHGYPRYEADATNWKGMLYTWTGPRCGFLVATSDTFAGLLY